MRLFLLYGLTLAGVGIASWAQAQNAQTKWVETALTPPTQAYPNTEFGGQTLRETLHATLGGSQMRVHFSNAYGTVPLVISDAQIADQNNEDGYGDTIYPATSVPLTFGGNTTISIPPGAEAVSDPANFTVTANTDYALSMYTPNTTGPATSHNYSPHFAFYVAGDQTTAATMYPETLLQGQQVFFVTGLQVPQTGGVFGIVTLGDSITDGYGSTVESDTSWPDDLSVNLNAKIAHTAVANAGIAGDQLLIDGSPGVAQGAIARLDRDVFSLPNATVLIVAIGINDIGQAGTNAYPGASDVIAGYQQVIQRAHEHGMKVVGATITPCQGFQYYNTVFEAKRQAINAWVRTQGNFDAVMDIDAAVRDPKTPTQLLAKYAFSDLIHLNSAGYAAVAAVYPRQIK